MLNVGGIGLLYKILSHLLIIRAGLPNSRGRAAKLEGRGVSRATPGGRENGDPASEIGESVISEDTRA
jgi:hypothetical protein